MRRLTPADAEGLAALAGGAGDAFSHADAAAWEEEIAAGSSPAWGVEEDGVLVAAAMLRTWGRSAAVPILAVDPARRRRGLGTGLLELLKDEALRLDLLEVGLEIDASALETAGFLLRRGFRSAGAGLVVRREVEDRGAGGAPELPSGLLDDPAQVVQAGESLDRTASSLDAALQPSAWLAGRLRAGCGDLLAPPGVDGFVLAQAEHRAGGEAVMRLVMAVVDERPPFARFAELAAEGLPAWAAARGAAAVEMTLPGRAWELLRTLLEAGYRPCAWTARLSLLGHPERADPRRILVLPWR